MHQIVYRPTHEQPECTNKMQIIEYSFRTKQILAIATREHEIHVFCFIDPLTGHTYLAPVGLKRDKTIGVRAQQIVRRQTPEHSECTE